MKKILGYSLLTAACVLLSGCATAKAEDGRPRFGYVNENITVKSGYYTCEEDDSYIHVDGNMIETCNFDYTAWVEREWARTKEELGEEELNRIADFNTVLEGSTELAMEFDALQEFVVYTVPISTYYPEKSDLTRLVLDYDSVTSDCGPTGGYEYGEDGSIKSGDIWYHYAGEELPE